MLVETSKTQDNYSEVLKILGTEDSEAKIIWHTIKQYPRLDIVEEARKCKNWWEENTKKKLKRPRQAYVNWLKNAEKFRQSSPDVVRERERDLREEKWKRDLAEAEAKKASPEKAHEWLQKIKDNLKNKFSS